MDVDLVNEILDVLSHHHRRFVIADLDGRPPPVDLADLATRAVESGRPRVTSGPAPTVEQMAIELHHRHLPKLDRAGLLTYRPSERTVVDCPALDLPDGWLSAPSVEPVLASSPAE